MLGRGPGKGRLRPLPGSETIRCWRCREVIVGLQAIRVRGAWEHLPDRFGAPSCPAPDLEEDEDGER